MEAIQEVQETPVPEVPPMQVDQPAPVDENVKIVDVYETAGGQVEVSRDQVKFQPAPVEATYVPPAVMPRTERQKTRLEEEQEAGRRAVERNERERAFRVPAPKGRAEAQIEATTPPQRTFSPAEHIPSMFSKGDQERGYKVL